VRRKTEIIIFIAVALLLIILIALFALMRSRPEHPAKSVSAGVIWQRHAATSAPRTTTDTDWKLAARRNIARES
jgi:hypothetical protein